MKTEINVMNAACTVSFRNESGCIVFSKTVKFEIPTRVTDKHDLCETDCFVNVECSSYRLATTVKKLSGNRAVLSIEGYTDHRNP